MKIIRENEEIEFTTILEDKDSATLFKHFKGNIYKIVTLAKDSEDLGDVVVYQGQYEDNPCWTRKSTDFFSKVNKEKYPDITQEYRFEKISK